VILTWSLLIKMKNTIIDVNMPNITGSFDVVFSDLLSILERKNSDYTANVEFDEFANFRLAELILGISVEKAIMVRLLDKVARISSLLEKKEPAVNESLDDSIIDAVGYLIILHAYLHSELHK